MIEKIFTLFIAITALAGCDENTSKDQNLSDDREFTVLHEGDYLTNGLFSIKQSKILVSQSLYETELANYNSDTPSVIDFSNNQVLLLDMGEQPSSGYAIQVSAIEEGSRSITVNILSTIPPSKDCTGEDVLTNPYQFVNINSIKPLVFKETHVEECIE